MENYIIKINHVEDAPPDSYVLYQMEPGGTFYCLFHDYGYFSKFLSLDSSNLCLTMDLSRTQGHAILFDIDIKFLSPPVRVETRDIMLDYFEKIFLGFLKSIFCPILKHYTILIAARSDRKGGLHIHMPELQISYDDYIELCTQLQNVSSVTINEFNAEIQLDIVKNFSLVNSAKPNHKPYEAVWFMYVDEKNQYRFNVSPYNSESRQEFENLQKSFKKRRDNENSLFRRFLLCEQNSDRIRLLKEAMMPVVSDSKPIYKLYYPTFIGPMQIGNGTSITSSSTNSPFVGSKFKHSAAANSMDEISQTSIATFIFENRVTYEMRKNLHSLCLGEKDWLKCFSYLKINTHLLSSLETQNYAVRQWYNRFKKNFSYQDSMLSNHSTVSCQPTASSHACLSDKSAAAAAAAASTTSSLFQKIEENLRMHHFHLRESSHPLNEVMYYDLGRFFLPVFYTLCNHLQLPSNVVISHLRSTFKTFIENGKKVTHNKKTEQHTSHTDEYILKLLDKLEKIPPKLFETVISQFTLKTLQFCAANMSRNDEKEIHSKISSVVEEMKGLLLFATSFDELRDAVRKIQEHLYPIMIASRNHTCKKPELYHWNPMIECWQTETKDNFERFIAVVLIRIETLVQENLNKDDYKEWLSRVKRRNLLRDLFDSIYIEVTLNPKVVEMDRHKWHLRTCDGILDLLTGHVGATVPEFYMSMRKLGVPFNRYELISFQVDCPDLREVYQKLTNKWFYQLYLNGIFDNKTNDLFQTLLQIVQENVEEKIDKQDEEEKKKKKKKKHMEYIQSMYEFFVHLCKYIGFYYDNFMIMMDILASLLVATNYMRKFFIIKGDTKNGKSKFFQMMKRAFGDYSYTARSSNLKSSPIYQGLGAVPEFARNLFECRIISIEELAGRLDENRIKDITGNSTTSFRNLYEQNSGGIPTAKLFASTNTFPECIATKAFIDRVIAIPFNATFESKQTIGCTTTAESVLTEVYEIDTSDSLVEDSYKGFFLMIYYHYFFARNMEDYLLHYRPEPQAFVEFKQNLLQMTDFYTQFKQYVDVQVIPHATNAMTTFDDLRSAIRYFLKMMRNISVQESDLLKQFDEEFQHLKKSMFPDLVSHEDFAGSSLSGDWFSQNFKPIEYFHNDDDDENEKIKVNEIIEETEDLENENYPFGVVEENSDSLTNVITFSPEDTQPPSQLPKTGKKRKMDHDQNLISKHIRLNSEKQSEIIYYDTVIIRNLSNILPKTKLL